MKGRKKRSWGRALLTPLLMWTAPSLSSILLYEQIKASARQMTAFTARQAQGSQPTGQKGARFAWVCMRVKEKVTTGSVCMMEPGARFRVMTPRSEAGGTKRGGWRDAEEEGWEDRWCHPKNCHSLEILKPFLSLDWPLATLASDLHNK